MRGQGLATVAGLVALVLWSSTVALARSASEALGPLMAAAVVYAAASGLVLARWAVKREGFRAWRPTVPLVVCGAMFVTYMVCLYYAVGRVQTRAQAIEVALLNYLWPALTILLAIPILRVRAGLSLVPGTLLALAGVTLVLLPAEQLSVGSMLENVGRDPVPYLLGIAAAVLWALYSNLTRRWAHAVKGSAEIYLIASAVCLGALALVAPETRQWSASALGEAVGLGVATFFAYTLWEKAMRQGSLRTVAAASYFTPLLSTALSALYLGISPTPQLWAGCGLLIAGSLVSWHSLRDRA